MTQNRNKLIKLFIGNVSNLIVHKILESAINQLELIIKYQKESVNSLKIAKKYGEKINPVNTPLQERDINYIREKIIKRAKAELEKRISLGYENIDLNLIEKEVDKILKEAKISD